MNIFYKVTWGDTLETIAQKFGIDTETLTYINKSSDLYVGKILRITYYRYYLSSDQDVIKRSLSFCLKRHSTKKRYYRIV